MAIDITREQAKLDSAKNTMAAAQAAYDDGLRGLLASDGRTPIAAPPEHERRTEALRDALAAKLATVDEQVNSVIASIEAQRLSVFADPMVSLDYAQLGLAGQYAPFVREDCERLPVPELLGRLEWVSKQPGAYLRLLYGRYGAQRFQSLLDAKPQPPELPELRAALEALGAIGATRGLSPELQNLRYAADGVKRATAYARSGQKPSTGPRITL